MSFTAGLMCISGNARGARASCSRACWGRAVPMRRAICSAGRGRCPSWFSATLPPAGARSPERPPHFLPRSRLPWQLTAALTVSANVCNRQGRSRSSRTWSAATRMEPDATGAKARTRNVIWSQFQVSSSTLNIENRAALPVRPLCRRRNASARPRRRRINATNGCDTAVRVAGVLVPSDPGADPRNEAAGPRGLARFRSRVGRPSPSVSVGTTPGKRRRAILHAVFGTMLTRPGMN